MVKRMHKLLCISGIGIRQCSGGSIQRHFAHAFNYLNLFKVTHKIVLFDSKLNGVRIQIFGILKNEPNAKNCSSQYFLCESTTLSTLDDVAGKWYKTEQIE